MGDEVLRATEPDSRGVCTQAATGIHLYLALHACEVPMDESSRTVDQDPTGWSAEVVKRPSKWGCYPID